MFFPAGTGPLLSDNMRRRELFSHDRKIPENQASLRPYIFDLRCNSVIRPGSLASRSAVGIVYEKSAVVISANENVVPLCRKISGTYRTDEHTAGIQLRFIDDSDRGVSSE